MSTPARGGRRRWPRPRGRAGGDCGGVRPGSSAAASITSTAAWPCREAVDSAEPSTCGTWRDQSEGAGDSCVRQADSRPSRSTRSGPRPSSPSAASVANLPPVMVTRPGSSSRTFGLARDVHRLLGVAGGDQGPNSGVRAHHVTGTEGAAEEVVHRLQQVGHVVARGGHVLEVSLVVVVGGARERPAEPGDEARAHHRRARSRRWCPRRVPRAARTCVPRLGRIRGASSSP